MTMVFTEAEVRRIIGTPVDIEAKYEEAHKHDGDWCAALVIDDDESEELLGERIASHCNFVADITKNEMIDEQLRQMMKICGESK